MGYVLIGRPGSTRSAKQECPEKTAEGEDPEQDGHDPSLDNTDVGELILGLVR
jgi:hypothetical protein